MVCRTGSASKHRYKRPDAVGATLPTRAQRCCGTYPARRSIGRPNSAAREAISCCAVASLIRRSSNAGDFNEDAGGGKIREIYLLGNERVRAIFEAWLSPFADLEATTITINNDVGVDAIAFDTAGLPGFQSIQDPLDYESRTHHSNMDVYDHIVPDDLRRNSVILASFVYHAAMREEALPGEGRKGEAFEFHERGVPDRC